MEAGDHHGVKAFGGARHATPPVTFSVQVTLGNHRDLLEALEEGTNTARTYALTRFAAR
jgi:hypothetical protein